MPGKPGSERQEFRKNLVLGEAHGSRHSKDISQFVRAL